MCVFFKIFIVFVFIGVCKGGSSKYVVSQEKSTFMEAFQHCKAKHMEPLEIHSAEEQMALQAELPTITDGWWHGYWLFATKLGNKQTFYWLNSGLPVNYTHFNDGEPNNYEDPENCLQILSVDNGRDYKWNDVPCDKTLKVICKKKQRSKEIHIFERFIKVTNASIEDPSQ